jgi:hypothetical protein
MRRLNEQLAHDQWRDFSTNMQRMGEQLARGLTQEAFYQASRALERAADRRQEKEERRREHKLSRKARKAARRQEAYELSMKRTSAVEGGMNILVALMFVAAAFVMPHVWWMIFLSVPFGIRGARIVGYHRAAAPALPEGSPAADSLATTREDPRAARIDEICNKLLAALKDAPKSVSDFLSTPEQTIESLRKACHDLLRREVALRVLVSPEETARLDRERAELEGRISAETDEIVRGRLKGAVAALDLQRAQHAEVLRSANRLEAERTRLGYTLDGLYAQIMRVRTAEGGSEDVVQAGLRQSLDQLRDEMGALADAVEAVNQSAVAASNSVPEDLPAPAGGTGGPQRVRG